MRQWPPITDGYSENFASLNRNKRSVALDLKDPRRARARARARARGRRRDREQPPGRDGPRSASATRRCKREKPTLVYCSISAFGQTGPRAQEGGFDLTVQAMSGIMSVTGEAGGAAGEVRRAALGLRLRASTRAYRDRRRAAASVRSGGAGGTSTSRCSAPRSASPRCRRANTSAPARSAQARLGASAQRAVPGVPRARRLLRAWRRATTSCGAAACAGDRREPTSPTTRASPRDAARAQPGRAARDPRGDFGESRRRRHCSGFPQRRACRARPINSYSQMLADPQVAQWAGCRTSTLPAACTRAPSARRSAIDGRAPRSTARPPALGEHTEEVLAGRRPSAVGVP